MALHTSFTFPKNLAPRAFYLFPGVGDGSQGHDPFSDLKLFLSVCFAFCMQNPKHLLVFCSSFLVSCSPPLYYWSILVLPTTDFIFPPSKFTSLRTPFDFPPFPHGGCPKRPRWQVFPQFPSQFDPLTLNSHRLYVQGLLRCHDYPPTPPPPSEDHAPRPRNCKACGFSSPDPPPFFFLLFLRRLSVPVQTHFFPPAQRFFL